MNEVEILSAYISKPRQLKKINGVMTPVFLKPYDKNYDYTQRFKKFNDILIKQGLTNKYLYDDKIIFNRETGKKENKSKYFKKGKVKSNVKQYLQFEEDIVQVNPAIQQLNNEGIRYTYANNFAQQPGQPFHSFPFRLKQILRGYTGQRILIKAELPIINWEKEVFLDIPASGFNAWYKQEQPWKYFEWASGEYIFDYEINFANQNTGDVLDSRSQAKMRIFRINDVNPNRYAQAFANSVVNHCVLQPVRDYLEFRIDNIKNKETSTVKKYTAAMNKLINWEMMYPVGKGIPINLLHQFCAETNFGIDLYLPDAKVEGRKWKSYRPPKEPTKIFKFINTCHNHLDITAQIDNDFRKNLSQEEFNDKLQEIQFSNDYYVYNKYQIITQQQIFQLQSEYNEIVKDFEKVNGLKRFRLNDKNPKQYILNQFIKASCVYNGCVDFKDTFMYRELDINNIDDLDRLEKYYGKSFYNYWDAKNCAEKFRKLYTRNLEEDNIKQIDLDKAYTRCDTCPCFSGYPAKITDMRKCNKIMGIGFYVIKNISNIPPHIEKLGIYFENNIYTSPELKYIKKLGVKYDIVAGAWGTSTKINWGPEKDAEGSWTGMYKKSENNIRNYVKWFGCSIKTTDHTKFQYRTDNLNYIENWKYESGLAGHEDVDLKYHQDNSKQDETWYNVFMHVPKMNVFHSSHIASFIYSYQRIIMMEQLLKIPIENIVRVCVDGIYYNDCNFEIMNNFNTDKDLRFGNIAGTTYRTQNFPWTDFSEFGENKPFHRMEVWTGAGGCGKTYENIIDKGNCDLLYVAHSWKLASAKRDEFPGLDVSVVQRLTMDDWYNDGKMINYWEPIANKYSTLIIDEITTLSNDNKKIIEKRFPHHKIIYCGDLNKINGKTILYQCPPIFNKNEKPEYFQITKFYKHYHLENNRRCQCKKLKKLLDCVRKIIENNYYSSGAEIINWINKNLNVIDKSTIQYQPNDMILSRTHKANEYYDNKYQNLNKYYITEKHYHLENNASGKIFNNNIYNGQIFLNKPDIPESKFRIRHGYTIDCIQGETATNNLIIDINGLFSWKHLYTAISRAKYFNQLKFVK